MLVPRYPSLASGLWGTGARPMSKTMNGGAYTLSDPFLPRCWPRCLSAAVLSAAAAAAAIAATAFTAAAPRMRTQPRPTSRTPPLYHSRTHTGHPPRRVPTPPPPPPPCPPPPPLPPSRPPPPYLWLQLEVGTEWCRGNLHTTRCRSRIGRVTLTATTMLYCPRVICEEKAPSTLILSCLESPPHSQ